MSAQHLPREAYILREMLCEHCADIYLQGYMSALYPSSVFSPAQSVSHIPALSGLSHLHLNIIEEPNNLFTERTIVQRDSTNELRNSVTGRRSMKGVAKQS